MTESTAGRISLMIMRMPRIITVKLLSREIPLTMKSIKEHFWIVQIPKKRRTRGQVGEKIVQSAQC